MIICILLVLCKGLVVTFFHWFISLHVSSINLDFLSSGISWCFLSSIITVFIKTATEVGVRAIQDHKVIEWNTCWKCRLLEGTDDI